MYNMYICLTATRQIKYKIIIKNNFVKIFYKNQFSDSILIILLTYEFS